MTNAITMATWVRPGRFATQELIKKVGERQRERL